MVVTWQMTTILVTMVGVKMIHASMPALSSRLARSTIISPTIKNSDVPVCKNCVNFIPWDNTNNEDSLEIGKCAKFGIRSPVSGLIKYDHAVVCRSNENKCGIKGAYFEPA